VIASVTRAHSRQRPSRSSSQRKPLAEHLQKRYNMRTPDLREVLERASRPQFIHGLRMEEISGVDHPAHLVEGWAVMKSRDSARKLGRIGSYHELVGGYAVVAKSVNSEKQYTLGLLYQASKPGEVIADAHGESISGEELFKARLAYVKAGDRSIHLQHGMTEIGLTKIGEWVDLAQWPYEVETEFKLPNGKTTKATIAANSVWVGIIWNDFGWKLVKSGQLRGLSLGGMRRKKSEEKVMAQPKDAIEGYTYEGVRKATITGESSMTNLGDADQSLGAPVAPVESPAQFKFSQLDPKLTDHKPRLNRRFQEFLRGIADGMEPDRYRRMLEIIAEFNDRFKTITDQAGHLASLKQLAGGLRKIMFNDHDVVQILRMGGFVAAEKLANFNKPTEREQYSASMGLGSAIEKMVRRGLNQHAFSDTFTGEKPDPIGIEAEKRKNRS